MCTLAGTDNLFDQTGHDAKENDFVSLWTEEDSVGNHGGVQQTVCQKRCSIHQETVVACVVPAHTDLVRSHAKTHGLVASAHQLHSGRRVVSVATSAMWFTEHIRWSDAHTGNQRQGGAEVARWSGFFEDLYGNAED